MLIIDIVFPSTDEARFSPSINTVIVHDDVLSSCALWGKTKCWSWGIDEIGCFYYVQETWGPNEPFMEFTFHSQDWTQAWKLKRGEVFFLDLGPTRFGGVMPY